MRIGTFCMRVCYTQGGSRSAECLLEKPRIFISISRWLILARRARIFNKIFKGKTAESIFHAPNHNPHLLVFFNFTAQLFNGILWFIGATLLCTLWRERGLKTRCASFFFQVRFQNQYQRLAAHGNCDFACVCCTSALFFSTQRAPIILCCCRSRMSVWRAKHCVKRARKERERFTCYYQGSATDPKAHTRTRSLFAIMLFLSVRLANLIMRERKYCWCWLPLSKQITCLIDRVVCMMIPQKDLCKQFVKFCREFRPHSWRAAKITKSLMVDVSF